MDKDVAQTFSWLCSHLLCQKVNYLKKSAEAFRNTEFYWGPSWLDKTKKAKFLFLLSESYRGLEFCSNTLKAVINNYFVAQINREGEQGLLLSSSSSWGHCEDNIQLGGEKENFLCKNSNISEWNLLLQHGFCWSASYSAEAAADTGSPAMTRFITNLHRAISALKFCSRAGQREPWGGREEPGCSSWFQK